MIPDQCFTGNIIDAKKPYFGPWGERDNYLLIATAPADTKDPVHQWDIQTFSNRKEAKKHCETTKKEKKRCRVFFNQKTYY